MAKSKFSQIPNDSYPKFECMMVQPHRMSEMEKETQLRKKRRFENLPEITQAEIEKYRRMSFTEKLQIINELNRAEERKAIEAAHQQHPEASDLELHLRAASRRIPADLLYKAFGWDAETGKFSMDQEQEQRVGLIKIWHRPA